MARSGRLLGMAVLAVLAYSLLGERGVFGLYMLFVGEELWRIRMVLEARKEIDRW